MTETDFPKFALAAAAALIATQAAAVPPLPAPPPPAAPSTLEVVIQVEGLTTDLLREYRPQLSGGLAQLAAKGLSSEPITSAPIGGKSVVVSGDAAIAPSDGRNWSWDGARFASADAVGAPPSSVTLINDGVTKLVARAEPPLTPPVYCRTKPSAGGRDFARAEGDYAAFGGSPALDGATLALAAGLIRDLGLGQDAIPDLLVIDLASTAKVARAYGAASEEACLQLFSLDRDLDGFLRAVEAMPAKPEVVLRLVR